MSDETTKDQVKQEDIVLDRSQYQSQPLFNNPSSTAYQGEKRMSNSKMTTLDAQLRAAESSLNEETAIATALESQATDNIAGANMGNIDKIRDILFGSNMRDYEKRFKRFEERLNKERANLREELLQRVKTIEDMVISETERLTEKAKVDRQERYEGQQDLIHEIKTLKSEINNRITQVDEQISKDIQQLRQQTHTKIQELNMQMRQQNESLTTLIKQEAQQLQEDKVNRHDLASFFTEFAVRLNKDFNMDHNESD